MVTEVYIEGNKLDLFEDETISVTQGVQDVKDISKLFADFSQSFNVPASRKNNQIFKSYYNQDIDNGFDARTRKAGLININTLPFKTGKIQLNGVKIKDNQPSSYKITFFGDAIKVKDLIGDDKLPSLDWLSNFNHDYDDTTVLEGLTTGLNFTVDSVVYNAAVIYPLISYNRQYLYDSTPTNNTSDEQKVNIAYNASRTDGVNFDELKPAIKLSIIIEAIQQKYGFNFTGSFFESQLFKQIYINLNKTTEVLSNGFLEYESQAVDITGIPYEYLIYSTTVTPAATFEETPYKIRLIVNGQTVFESPNFVTGQSSGFNNFGGVPNEFTLQAQIITESDFDFTAVTGFESVFTFSQTQIAPYPQTYALQSIDLRTIITDEIKEIKTYDFLTSLFKTFNLIVTADGNDILVEDLPTWYASGQIIDVTKYIDTKQKEVDKGVIFKNMNFKFKESDQILADEFLQSNDKVYGNEELTLYTDETETVELDGDTLDIESIFENPIHERLFNLIDNTQTSIQYCPYFNREIKSISKNIFMFYGLPTDITSNPIGWKGVGAGISQITGNVIMPSHSQIIDTDSFNLNFAAEYNEYTGSVYADTIYNRFYSDYVGDIFSNKRRNFKFKGILPLSILNSLKLNDRLVIGNTRYLQNKIVSNLTIRGDSLELINDIYDAPLASDLLNSSIITPSFSNYNGNVVTASITYIGIANQTPTLLDVGDGDKFITIDSYGTGVISTITFSLTLNNFGNSRSVVIEVLDGLNNPKFSLTQESIPVGALNFSQAKNSALVTLITSKT